MTRYPPPAATHADASVGRWTVQAVRGILENPKYTGYQVWNRRARKNGGNKANPITEWVWSPQPVHEPLVTREIFDMVWAGRRDRQGSRGGAEVNSHPGTRRTYLLRSYVHCALCARRMSGKTSKELGYFVCYKNENRRSTADWSAEHPKALWVREKILVDAVHWFFGERVFGPQRSEHLQAQLASTEPGGPAAAPDPKVAERRQREVAEIERRQGRLLDQLADEDHGDPETSKQFRRGLRERYDRFERDRRSLLAEAREHERHRSSPTAQPIELFDALPQLGTRMAEIPEPLQRTIYDAFHLEVHYHRPRHEIQLQVTVPEATARDLRALATRVLAPAANRDGSDQPSFGCPQLVTTRKARC